MYIQRLAEAALQHSFQSSKVLIILGARQVGKTTLVQHFLRNKKVVYLNLDIGIDWNRLQAATTLPPRDALKSFGLPDVLVIDEAQRKPETSSMVKGWYDAQIPVKMILLGSSSLNLLHQIAENLTGRNEKLFLPPLLFKEIVASKSWYSPIFSEEQLQDSFHDPLQTLLLQSLV